MTNEAPANLAFYCPQHLLRFHATRDAVVICEQGGHALADNFPENSWWEYCCDCDTFWPSNPPDCFLGEGDCLVCERETIRRYVCAACQVVSIESDALIRRKRHSISVEQGILPSCPACMTQTDRLSEHHCPEIEAAIFTSRSACPFCETFIQVSDTQGNGRHEDDALSSLSHQAADVDAAPETGKGTGIEFQDGLVASEFQVPSWQSTPPRVLPQRRVPWKLTMAAVVITVVVVLAIAISLSERRRSPSASEADHIPAPPAGMVYVKGGEFTMGNDLGDEYERPAHKTTVPPFFMDVNEVTNEDYYQFVKSTGRKPPIIWKTGIYPSDTARQPIVGVSWYDASDYAKWARKRLPREEEWEFAARGSDARIYPWGNEWRSNVANAGDNSAGHLTNVGSYPDGKSPFGVLDMIGNAWEWTSTDLKAYPGSKAPSPPGGARKIIRGASWVRDHSPDWTATYRGFALPVGGKDYSKIGFRCVSDVAPATPRK